MPSPLIETGIVFDTETTGLIRPDATDITKQPYITEMYCLKYTECDGEFDVIGEFDARFKIPIKVPAEITKITGITDEMLENERPFEACIPTLSKFFTGVDVMVAHNIAFDRSMLANELVRHNKVLNFPWPRRHICTVEKTLYIQQRRINLRTLHEELFAEGFPNAHRAKGDVLPLYRCYKELRRRSVL